MSTRRLSSCRAQFAHTAAVCAGQPFLDTTTFWYDASWREIYLHSNVVGRMRANAAHNARVCFKVLESENFLPSNVALELLVQFRSVIAFGALRVSEHGADKERALYGLMRKYFSHYTVGALIRPLTDKELKRTSVYAIAITEWSGQENWVETVEQREVWAELPTELLSANE